MKPEDLTVEQAQKRIEDFRAKKPTNVQPTVSASDLTTPTKTPTPPVPTTPTPSTRTADLIGNVTTNTQDYITAQSEEAKKANELASLLGTQTFDGAGQREQLGRDYNLPQNLSRLTDIQTQLTKANTASDLTKARIAGGAGQTLAQGQREITQEDRENSIRNAGLAAEASVLQGSIETAGTLINQAMSDFYQDRQLKNQNMIQQLDYYSGIADKQTAQLLEQEKRKYEADQAKIKEVKDAVKTAMVNGATAQEMRQLSNPDLDDDTRLSIANAITARGSNEERNLDMAYKEAQIANVYDQMDARQVEATNKALEAQEKATKGNTAVTNQFNRANRVINQIDQVLPKVSGFTTTGIMGLTQVIPGTPAKNLKTEIDSIKANLGFNELQEMRNASPTGGALGQVAVQELEFLQSTLGNLSTLQSPAQLRENLVEVRQHFANWKAVTEAEQTGFITVVSRDGVAGSIPAEELDDALNEGYRLP